MTKDISSKQLINTGSMEQEYYRAAMRIYKNSFYGSTNYNIDWIYIGQMTLPIWNIYHWDIDSGIKWETL